MNFVVKKQNNYRNATNEIEQKNGGDTDHLYSSDSLETENQ